MIEKFIALLVTGCFCVLCSYSYGVCCGALDNKIIFVWKDKNSAALADVYGLTPDSVDEPIGIWKKP